MRLLSGDTGFIGFVAYADTGTNPGTARLNGYAAKFTAYYSRNGGTVTQDTGPTFKALSAGNMPGVYAYLVDRDTTLGAGNLTESYVIHINDTGGHVRPVTREIEIFRTDTGATATVDTGQIVNAVWNSLKADHGDTGTFGEELASSAAVDVSSVISKLDTGVSAEIAAVTANVSAKLDTGVSAEIAAVTTLVSAKLDTGTVSANITQVNAATITGTGDTGTGDTWRPA